MKKIKRLVVSVLTVALSVSGASALTAFADGTAEPEQKQVYESEMMIGGWIQFYDTSSVSYTDQVKALARSGMNLIDSPNARSNSGGSGSATTNVDEFV